MKTTKLSKIIIAFLVITLSVLYSCSDSSDNPATQTTVAEDKQNITNTFNSFYSCLNTLDDGDLSDFLLYSLFNNTNQEYNDTWIKSLSNKFEAQYGDIILNDRLQFANKTGVYTYNVSTESWTKVANSSLITLRFPSVSTQSTIDSELTLSSYNDTSVTYSSNAVWLPTDVNLTLKRNDVLLFSLNLSNVTFDVNTNFSMPTSATVSIFTSPYSHTFQWSRTTSTQFQFNYNSSTLQGCTTSFNLTVNLQDADYGNITSLEEDVKTVSGSLTQGNLKVVYAINVEAIAAFDDPTPTQINNNSDAEVFYNDLKIGDLVYQENNGKSEVYIVYSDGSTENVEVYVGDFQAQIETIFENYIN